MKYIFVDESWEDYIYWQKTDKKILDGINEEHRLIYRVGDDEIQIAKCSFH